MTSKQVIPMATHTFTPRTEAAARAARWLTACTAVLVAGISATGLWAAGLYTDGAAVEAMPRTPVRAVAGILLLMSGGLAAFQLSGLAEFALTGTVPQEPSRLVVPLTFTRLGAVLDLSLLVPAYVLAAVWLWRRRAWGFVLAAAVLVAGALHQVSYVAGMVFQLAAAIPGAAFDPYVPVIMTLFAAGGGLLLANLRPAKPQAAPTEPDRAPAAIGR
jgi:hypothetical protein